MQIPCYIPCLFCRSKYFRGKRLHGDYDIRVEQAEFKELSLTANVETGTTVSMAVFRNGTKVVRSFRPDFVLIRQNLRDAGEDNKNLLLGFKFGGVPSINSLHAIYNFQVGNVFFCSLNVERTGAITASLKLSVHAMKSFTAPYILNFDAWRVRVSAKHLSLCCGRRSRRYVLNRRLGGLVLCQWFILIVSF